MNDTWTKKHQINLSADTAGDHQRSLPSADVTLAGIQVGLASSACHQTPELAVLQKNTASSADFQNKSPTPQAPDFGHSSRVFLFSFLSLVQFETDDYSHINPPPPPSLYQHTFRVSPPSPILYSLFPDATVLIIISFKSDCSFLHSRSTCQAVP